VILIAIEAPAEVVWMPTFYLGMLFGSVLKALFAVHACRFFAEARRTGALDLLLATPLTSREIVSGQWQALRRTFLWPLIVFFISAFAPLPIQALRLAWAKGTLDGAAVISHLFGGGILLFLFVLMAMDFSAIGWFGMWLALSLRKPALATGLTILFLVLLPLFAFCLWPLLFVADAVLIAVSWSKVNQDLRKRMAEQFQAPTATPAASARARP